MMHKLSESVAFYDMFIDQEKDIARQYSKFKTILAAVFGGLTFFTLRLVSRFSIKRKTSTLKTD